MNLISVDRTLSALRDFAPYFLVEPLLPGGTLVALLLWLSQRFVRDGFGDVRQYPKTPAPRTAVILGKTKPSRKRSRLCFSRCRVVTVWRDRVRQWCETIAAARQCCA